MKLKHTIILPLFLALTTIMLPASAYVVTEETTTPEYLINNGYSAVTADHVQLVKHQNRNEEYKSGRSFKKPWWRKAWEYINFGADDGQLLQHNIKPEPSYTDW